MLHLVEYIKNHKNWRELLKDKPYSLKIRDEGNYTLFMYNQIDSDFYNPIVKESRGIILDLTGEEPRVVCRAFDKFGNYGEGYVDDIDWASAQVQEKIDGSIVKLWFDAGEWHLSSNGCIDAFMAKLNSGFSIGDLFIGLFDDFLWDKLDKDYTYIFELVTPYNKVVIDYGESALWYIGKRNNLTGLEEEPEDDLGLKRPALWSLHSLNACVEAAAELNANGEINTEGFVVVDKNFHRIKVKSPLYVAKHHVVTDTPSFEDMVTIWQRHEEEEFLTYFPLYKEVFNKINDLVEGLDCALGSFEIAWEDVDHNKKAFAFIIKDDPYAWAGFDAIKYGDWSIERITKKPAAELARILKKYIN